jgi:hypothetical protein
MASFLYSNAKMLLMNTGVDLNVASAFHICLVMTNTTTNTQNTITTMSGWTGGATGLDECDGVGYSRQTLTNLLVTEATTYAWWDFDNVTFTSVAAATRSIQGAVIYKGVVGAASDATNVPVAYIDFSAPFAANGSNILITWAASPDGVMKLT